MNTAQVSQLQHRRLPSWFTLFGVVAGGYVLLPFLAPALMAIGWVGLGKAIYFIYSFLCHQLPERSYFLFGLKFTYSLSEIQAAWQNTTNPLILRQFIGNPEMGWKLAWSDRMVSMFTSIWIFGLLWFPFAGSYQLFHCGDWRSSSCQWRWMARPISSAISPGLVRVFETQTCGWEY